MEITKNKDGLTQKVESINQAIKEKREANQYWAFHSEILPDFKLEMFKPGYWQCKEDTACTTSGRGNVIRFSYSGRRCILRHYQRGGWVQRLTTDYFLCNPWSENRAVSEWQLLWKMKSLCLPVPQPLAVRVLNKGIFCQMDIVTEEISNSQNLVEHLESEALNSTHWENIGSVVRLFHNQNIDHADLNAHNVLIDQEYKVWLIDFDKSRLRSETSTVWKTTNLNRFKRSLQKESRLRKQFFFTDENWQSFMLGYQN